MHGQIADMNESLQLGHRHHGDQSRLELLAGSSGAGAVVGLSSPYQG
jgi:hypothetical protein